MRRHADAGDLNPRNHDEMRQIIRKYSEIA